MDAAQQSGSVNAWAQVKLGAEFEAGQFVFVKSKVWGQVKSSIEIGASLTEEHELGLSITNGEEFSTSGNDNITGETGDVYAGASLNMVYALTDVIHYDPATCSVNKSVDMIMAPKGFKTTFIYTESHIQEVLISQLEQIRDLYTGTNADSAAIYQNQIKTWQEILALNADLKKKAEFSKNISFSSGTPYNSFEDVTTSTSNSIEFGMYIEQAVAIELGFEFGGVGVSGGVDVKFRLDMGVSGFSSTVSSTTTGYTLEDDDGGDFFSVDVFKDHTYGTPVFKLVSGRSSCPWEPGTQPRDGVQLISDTYNQQVNNPDDPAVYKLSLGNTSQSDEERTYDLVFLQESNPDGAVLTLGGSQVQGGIPTPYTIPAGGSVDATVTVERGPTAYDYNNLRFALSSQCDGSISNEVALSAHFTINCSDISLGKPLDNWLVSTSSNNVLQAQLLDYDIRAKLACTGVVKYSDVRSGIVDRTAPLVFGQPSPTDGVLDAGDLISVTFNEDINCVNISTANVELMDVSKNQVLSTQVGCSGDKIIILPDTAGLTFQDDTFKVMVTSIEDVYGNEADTVTWAFSVPGPGNFGVNDDDDTDGDGIINSLDNCLIAYNPDQADQDGDGIGDLCDPDIDGDGIMNDLDNCPFVANLDQADADSNGVGNVCESTGIKPLDDRGTKLFDCYPNPFSNYTTIKYSVTESCWTVVKVYNLLGKEIAVLSDQKVISGTHELTWNSRDFEQGVYFFSLQMKRSDGTWYKKMKKMILSR